MAGWRMTPHVAAHVFVFVPGEKEGRLYGPGQEVRIGAFSSLEVVLRDDTRKVDTQGKAKERRRIPGHIATIQVLGKAVTVRHENPHNRDHGLWVIQDGKEDEVPYGLKTYSSRTARKLNSTKKHATRSSASVTALPASHQL